MKELLGEFVLSDSMNGCSVQTEQILLLDRYTSAIIVQRLTRNEKTFFGIERMEAYTLGANQLSVAT